MVIVFNGRYSKSEHIQSLGNAVTCLGTRGEIDWFGESIIWVNEFG